MNQVVQRSGVPALADRSGPPTNAAGLGRSTLLIYSFGSAAFGIKEAGLSAFLLIYYNQVLGVEARLVGAVMMLALLLDAFMDPLIGYASDHLRSRFGRRHPFMYAAIVPAAIGYMLLWNPPALTQLALLGYLGMTVFLVRTSTAAYEIPNAALVAELTQGYERRTALQSMRFMWGWLAGMIMTILAFSVMLQPTGAFPVGQLNPAGYREYGWWAGAIILIAGLASALGTHRLIPLLRRLQASERRSHRARDVLREIVGIVRQPSVAALLLGAGATSTASGIVFSLNSYVNTYIWQLNAAQIAIVQSGPLLGVIAAIMIAPVVSRRFDKRQIATASLLASVVIAPIPFVLKLAGLFPTASIALALTIIVVSAAANVGLNVLAAIEMASMTADLVEDNELRTGERIEGIIFSANAFVQKCASGIGIFLASLLLDVTAFSVRGSQAIVDDGALRSLTISFCVLVAVLNLVAVAALRRYRIGRVRHAQSLELLARREAMSATA